MRPNPVVLPFVLVCALASIVASAALAAARPAISAPVDAPGTVTLYRDEWGVPYIYAQQEPDAFYALGYAQAEDQRVGILSAALAVEGRAGAVFGDADLPWGIPIRAVEPAAFIWRHAEEAKAAFARLAPPLRRNQEAYVAGFNAWLAEHPAQTPEWAPRLQPWHMVGIPRALLWFFIIGDGLRECARAGAPLTVEVDPRDARIDTLFASNEWVVAPSRTADGDAMVLSDPHSIIDGSLFYEFRMKAGELDVLGYTLGTSMILAHNPDLAWGMTTGGPDVSDCYALTLDPRHPTRYRIHGKWRTFETRQWVHEIKGKPAEHGSTDYALINGLPAPVVARKSGVAYAIATPYFSDAGGILEQTDAMVRARSVAALRRASERNGLFPQNVMAADRSGSLFYLRDGRVPRRDPSIDWTAPVSGDDPRTRWRGLHPSTDLVQVLDPPSGYMQNNNTSPDHMVAGAPLVRADQYASYLYNDRPDLRFFSRADRTNEVLSGSPQLTVAAAKALALDETWIGHDAWTRWLAAAVEAAPARVAELSPPGRRVLNRLLRFDGVANSQSVAALNHYFWRSAVWSALPAELRSSFTDALAGRAQAPSLQARALDAVETAVRELQSQLGSVDRPYGDYFRLSRDGVVSWPLGGGPPLALKDYGQCVPLERPPYVCALTQRAMLFRARLADGRPRATEGSRALRLVVLGDTPRTFSLHNYGQSDDPASPHYTDQARLLTSPGLLKEVPFELDDLLPTVERTTVLHPPANR
jgi:acyl-homoserine-lactone acylase